jgi:hypothetical protein
MNPCVSCIALSFYSTVLIRYFQKELIPIQLKETHLISN